MYFDLNVPVPTTSQFSGQNLSKKGKGKAPQHGTASAAVYTTAQMAAIEERVALLVSLGYSVIAFNQTIVKRVDAKTHINVLDPLLAQLKKRDGVIFLKRLTLVLDESSEGGTGLTNANAALIAPYDLLALVPTTSANLSLACLVQSQPSPLTAHIISLPLTLPRLPFHLKHTLVRTAIKNGAVFEINYAGAISGESDPELVNAGGAENGPNAKRNWWAAARELARVTKGKGILVSGGVADQAELRAPRDVGNLITLLGLPQDAAHAASTKTAKSLVLRAQTRKTYRAVFSEPTVVIPTVEDVTMLTEADPQPGPENNLAVPLEAVDHPPKLVEPEPSTPADNPATGSTAAPSKKRTRDLAEADAGILDSSTQPQGRKGGVASNKRRKGKS